MASEAIGTVLEGAIGGVKVDQLILVNLSSMDCHSWLTAMRDAGQPWHEDLVNNLAKAKVLLQSQPQAHLLICYDNPEEQIANHIDNDHAPSQALANWMDQVGSLLEFYRQHYHGITLVERETLYCKPKELCKQLAARSGIALDQVNVKKPAEALEPDVEQQVVVNRLLAKHALQHPPAKSLAQELEASSLPSSNKTELFNLLDRTYETLKQGGGVANFKDLQQENDLIIEQLHKTQEELEQYILGNKGGTQKVEKLERIIKEKNEKLHDFSQKNKKLTSQLKDLRNSKSWKLTAPLRKALKILGGKRGGGA